MTTKKLTKKETLALKLKKTKEQFTEFECIHKDFELNLKRQHREFKLLKTGIPAK